MWCYTAVGFTLAGGALCIATTHHRKQHDIVGTDSLVDRIEKIRTIDQVVRLLQTLAYRSPTEDVVSHICEAIEMHGIAEAAVDRLSRLHRHHGNELGARGYAINLLWSTVLEAIASHNSILIVDDDLRPLTPLLLQNKSAKH